MIHLVVALACEARPVIDRYRLRGLGESRQSGIFEGDGLKLVVAGIGKQAAARGVRALDELEGPREPRAWLNFGLAGHREWAVGRAFLARLVEDGSQRTSWQIEPAAIGLETAVVRSVDRPEQDYGSDVLYEMEAAGFMSAIATLRDPGPVQVLKIVSDNRSRSTRQLTAALAEELIASRLREIEALVDLLGRSIE